MTTWRRNGLIRLSAIVEPPKPRRRRPKPEEDKPKLEQPFDEEAFLQGRLSVLGGSTDQVAPPRGRSMLSP